MAKFNFYIGAGMSAWLLAVMVIVAEIFVPFKDTLKNIFTHHWIGKGVIIAAAFVAFGFLFGKKSKVLNFSDDNFAWYSILGSLAVIFLFFVIEFLK